MLGPRDLCIKVKEDLSCTVTVGFDGEFNFFSRNLTDGPAVKYSCHVILSADTKEYNKPYYSSFHSLCLKGVAKKSLVCGGKK